MIQELTELTGFVEDMPVFGRIPTARVVSREFVPADCLVAEKLAITMGTPVVQIRRIRLSDGVPLSFDETYLPEDVGHKVMADDLEVVAAQLPPRGGLVEALIARDRTQSRELMARYHAQAWSEACSKPRGAGARTICIRCSAARAGAGDAQASCRLTRASAAAPVRALAEFCHADADVTGYVRSCVSFPPIPLKKSALGSAPGSPPGPGRRETRRPDRRPCSRSPRPRQAPASAPPQ